MPTRETSPRAREWWVSTRNFTCIVRVSPVGVVIWASPVVRSFTGQRFENLIDWCRGIGGLMYVPLDIDLSNWKGMTDERANH